MSPPNSLHWQHTIENTRRKKNFKLNDIYSILNEINNINNNINNNNINNINNINNNNNNNNNNKFHIESVFMEIISMLVKKIESLEYHVEELICCKPAINSSITCNFTSHDQSLIKCCICIDNEKEYAYVNCGHMCVCKECQQGEWVHKCPICKTDGRCIKIFK